MDCHVRDLPLSHRASKLKEIGQIPKMTVHKLLMFSTKFDDLGVIITRKRCSIQQGEENNCWS